MGRFEFKDRSISVDICGKQYAIETSEKKAEAVQKLAEQFPKLDGEDREAQIEALVKIVDTVLGTGSAATIFSDRPFSLEDLADLVEFLAAEINAENKRNENRAVRRTAAKSKK